MKKNRFLKLLLVSNIVLLTALGLMANAYINKPVPQNNELSIAQAKAYCSNNKSELKAIMLSKKAINSMNELLSRKSSATGVRLYFGQDNDGNAVNVLISTKSNYLDDTSLILKETNTVATCPRICDSQSEINN